MELEESSPARDHRSEREPVDFGQRLRQARERRGASLRQIAIATKISATALEALERNDPSRLPGGIFSRAFVRSYAAEVGLDPEQTVRDFIAHFPTEAGSATPAHALEAPDEEFENRRQVAGATLWLLLLSVPVAIFLIYFTMFRASPTPEPPPQTTSEAGATGSAGSTAPPPTATEPGSAPTALAGTGETPTALAPPPAATDGLNIRITPTGPCWVAITVDRGAKTGRLLQAGETETYRVTSEIVMEVGDAGAFQYAINGRPGRSLGGAGQVVITRITPDNFQTYLQQ